MTSQTFLSLNWGGKITHEAQHQSDREIVISDGAAIVSTFFFLLGINLSVGKRKTFYNNILCFAVLHLERIELTGPFFKNSSRDPRESRVQT